MTDELKRTPGTLSTSETAEQILVRRARAVVATYFETARAIKDQGHGVARRDRIDRDHIMQPLLCALRDIADEVAGEIAPGPYIDYRRVEHTEPGYRDGQVTEHHESFGVAQFNRVSGSCGRLFASPLEDHMGMIRLTIDRAQRVRSRFDNANYWPAYGKGVNPSGAGSRTICEVNMSSTQFAELITTMNSGSGTPVTIHEVTGTRMAPVPTDVKHEATEIVDDIKAKLDGRSAHAAVAKADAILEKKSIGKGDRAMLRGLIHEAADAGTKELPYYMQRFTEACEGISATAKAEVVAAANAVIHATGIEALRKGMAPVLSTGEPKKGRTRLPPPGYYRCTTCRTITDFHTDPPANDDDVCPRCAEGADDERNPQ